MEGKCTTGPRITKCPLCGGRIQATRKEYMDRLTLDAEGDVIDDGHCVDSETTDIYCENDHTHEEMCVALENRSEDG